MAQPSASDVKNVIDTDLSTSIIDAHISDAYQFMQDWGMSDNATVQKWLAAHLISTSRQRQLTEGTGGPASATYAGNFGMGLRSTTYGQTAIALDATGKLAQADKQIKAGGGYVKITSIKEDYG